MKLIEGARNGLETAFHIMGKILEDGQPLKGTQLGHKWRSSGIKLDGPKKYHVEELY